MTRTPCPPWCDGTHPVTDEGIYHCVEIGRLDSGELDLVVSVAHWIPDVDDDTGPVVTMSWEADGYLDLLSGIELEPDGVPALIPLLQKANETLRAGRCT